MKNHKIAIFVHLCCQYTLSSALQDAFVCSVSQKCLLQIFYELQILANLSATMFSWDLSCNFGKCAQISETFFRFMSIVYMLFVVRLLLIALLECIRVCYGVICRSVDTVLARVCSATLPLFSSLPLFVSKTQSMSVRDVGHYSLCLLLWRSSVHHAAQVVHSFGCVFCTAKFAILLMN